jgi:hypothetical protein
MTVYCWAILSLVLLRSAIWQFYVTCIVLGLVVNGAAHLAYSRSISTWFQKRLGMALAFVMVEAGLVPCADSFLTRAETAIAFALHAGRSRTSLSRFTGRVRVSAVTRICWLAEIS